MICLYSAAVFSSSLGLLAVIVGTLLLTVTFWCLKIFMFDFQRLMFHVVTAILCRHLVVFVVVMLIFVSNILMLLLLLF